MVRLPPPTEFVGRAFPRGLPVIAELVNERTNLFQSAIDPDGTPGDPGLFGPGSPTWELVGQPSGTLGGLRAALLQSLSAPVPTATHSTGRFYDDFMGRVARTGAFVQQQNLGSMDEVYRSARRVRAMHRTVKGTWDDGLEYDASDPHQQAWVSMTFTDSIMVAADRFGRGRLPRARADQYVREQSTHAALLDHRVDLDAIFEDPDQRAELQAGTLPLPLIEEGELPTTVRELEEMMKGWVDELFVTDLTRQLIDATVRLSEIPERQRRLLRPFVLATLSTVPDDLHELMAPTESRVEEHLAAQVVQGPLMVLQALFGRSPAVDVARRRVAAGNGHSTRSGRPT